MVRAKGRGGKGVRVPEPFVAAFFEMNDAPFDIHLLRRNRPGGTPTNRLNWRLK